MMNKYVFRKYDKKFINLYNLEENKIKKILKKEFFIEHIRSPATLII